MAINERGLDAIYFGQRLGEMADKIDIFTPDDMVTILSNLLLVAATQANISCKIKFKNKCLEVEPEK